MNKAVAVFNALPFYGKVAVGIGGVIVVYIVGKSISTYLSNDRMRMLKESESAGGKLAELAVKGIKPTYSNTQYEAFSNKIVAAINDCGTDEQAVYDVFNQLKNEAYLYKLIEVYKLRKFKGCGSSYFGFEERSLSGSITYEMSSSEIRKINDIMKSKNINYSF